MMSLNAFTLNRDIIAPPSSIHLPPGIGIVNMAEGRIPNTDKEEPYKQEP